MSEWAAVVGTLAGASVGGGITWVIERSKWSRQLNIRWDDTRRRLYGEFAGAIRGWELNVTSIIEDPDMRRRRQVIPGQLRDVISSYAATARRSLPEIEIVGGRDVAETALRLHNACADLAGLVMKRLGPDSEEAKLERQAYDTAYWAFIDAARKELGLPRSEAESGEEAGDFLGEVREQ